MFKTSQKDMLRKLSIDYCSIEIVNQGGPRPPTSHPIFVFFLMHVCYHVSWYFLFRTFVYRFYEFNNNYILLKLTSQSPLITVLIHIRLAQTLIASFSILSTRFCSHFHDHFNYIISNSHYRSQTRVAILTIVVVVVL